MRRFVAVAVLCATACSSAPKQETVLKGMYLPTLHVRRPPGAPADPLAYTFEKGYRSDPLPDARLDCAPADTLFKDIALARVRECLKQLNEPLPRKNPDPKQKEETLYPQLHYRFVREPQPSLELVVPDSTKDPDDARRVPACIRQVLPQILVPREVVYQSAASPEERPVCYVSRVSVEKEMAFWLFETHKIALKVDFPISPLPASDEEVRALLKAWALAPLWEDPSEPRVLHGKILPDPACGRCMADHLIHPLDPRPPLWP